MAARTRSQGWKDLHFLQFLTGVLFVAIVPTASLLMKEWDPLPYFHSRRSMVGCCCLFRIEQSTGSAPAARSPSCARMEMGLPFLTDRIAVAAVCARDTLYTVSHSSRNTTNLGIKTTDRAGAIHSPLSSAGVIRYPTQGSVMRYRGCMGSGSIFFRSAATRTLKYSAW